MSLVWKVTAFVAQSVALGLAIAFVAVLIKPELINRAAPASPGPASYAQAVAASAPAVAVVYADLERTVGTAPNAPPVTTSASIRSSRSAASAGRCGSATGTPAAAAIASA